MPGITWLDTPRSITATAVGTGHENRADAFRRVLREDPTGSGGLVVGVGVYCHERQGPVSHERNLLQRYISVQLRGGRTAILGTGSGWAHDLVVSVFPACAAPAPVDATART